MQSVGYRACSQCEGRGFDALPPHWSGIECLQEAADGTTLLHIAAEAGDAESVRYLLAQGMDPSTPGKYDLPALGGTHDEDVAMVLLEAGADLTQLNEGGYTFREYAEYNHWARVGAWLGEHGRVIDHPLQVQKRAGALRD